MDSKIALFLFLNLFIFTLTSAHGGGAGEGGKCTSCTPTPKKRPQPLSKCPVDALKLGVCANLLEHLLRLKLGEPPVRPCCSLIQNIADLEAALCLCTAIRASLLGIKLDVPVSLSLLLNACGKKAPAGFQCPKLQFKMRKYTFTLMS
ncbi:uncharacterized protein [Phyllobates terribilis]|uniref:uncharacterized protein n=1 Tax=Phyllobates terribilis TaxID=111132 RepID=UPI003CCAD20E